MIDFFWQNRLTFCFLGVVELIMKSSFARRYSARNRPAIVTNDQWSCGGVSGGEIKGVKNSVRRGKHRGDLDGKIFANSEERDIVNLERGYTQFFVSPWCPWCRKEHKSFTESTYRSTDGKTYKGRSRLGWCPKYNRFLVGLPINPKLP